MKSYNISVEELQVGDIIEYRPSDGKWMATLEVIDLDVAYNKQEPWVRAIKFKIIASKTPNSVGNFCVIARAFFKHKTLRVYR